jgi:predicted deacetylase
VPALALHSFSRAIEIPVSLRDQPLDAWKTSARLTAVLDRFGIRLLGDLHGRKVVDFAWEKNCGPKTLYELDLLARRAQSRKGKRLAMGIAAAAFMLRTRLRIVSARQPAKGPRQRCRKM